MSAEPIYVKFSEEVRRLLVGSDIDLQRGVQTALRENGLDATIKWEPDPLASGSQKRDVVLVILAAGLTATLVGTAVSKIIDSISRGKHATMTERQLRPALDGKGQPIRDRDGNPVFESTEKPGASAPGGETGRTKVTAGKLLEFELATGEAAKGTK